MIDPSTGRSAVSRRAWAGPTRMFTCVAATCSAAEDGFSASAIVDSNQPLTRTGCFAERLPVLMANLVAFLRQGATSRCRSRQPGGEYCLVRSEQLGVRCGADDRARIARATRRRRWWYPRTGAERTAARQPALDRCCAAVENTRCTHGDPVRRIVIVGGDAAGGSRRVIAAKPSRSHAGEIRRRWWSRPARRSSGRTGRCAALRAHRCRNNSASVTHRCWVHASHAGRRTSAHHPRGSASSCSSTWFHQLAGNCGRRRRSATAGSRAWNIAAAEFDGRRQRQLVAPSLGGACSAYGQATNRTRQRQPRNRAGGRDRGGLTVAAPFKSYRPRSVKTGMRR